MGTSGTRRDRFSQLRVRSGPARQPPGVTAGVWNEASQPPWGVGWWQLGIRRVWPVRLQATAPRLCFGHCPRLTGPLAQPVCYRAPPGPGPVWAAPVTLPFLYQDGQGGQATHPLRCSALEAGTPGLPDLHLQPWLPAGPAQPGPSFRAIQTGPCCRWRRLGRAAPPPSPPSLAEYFSNACAGRCSHF